MLLADTSEQTILLDDRASEKEVTSSSKAKT